ncbi:acyl-CoA synthetase [Xinfangfangia sp. D13-10-4-6]|uniref:acyl-CoA synthetase n=1 Tax=Pseudogemmobacter hezensis TaxID=2737662 RepID=UPI0015524D40|nr:acyl-CoA synthetase [Pseudogemmobacter hezensis]NPD13806.1 acyl-CoA synthetase [Pseudogemmobacter hezensis]
MSGVDVADQADSQAVFATLADVKALEAQAPWSGRDVAKTIYQALSRTRASHGSRDAISFQLLSDPGAHKTTLSWAELHRQVTQAANLLRSLGIGPQDVVAYILPNTTETVVTLLGGMVAGIVNPINPLLEAAQIASILRETRAKVVVTLRAFPKSDVSQKVAEALREAPDVRHLLEVDLLTNLTGLKRLVVPFMRPKTQVQHRARLHSFHKALARQPGDRLTFEDPAEDRVAAYFHTGGTTGMPKVAQHRVSGMVYNGWIGAALLFRETDVVMCPLPLFHVFAVYPILMSMIASGGHVVLPTPAGYRGEGVFDNLWKLIERYRCTYLVTVPTALAALMQRPVDADISSLRAGFSGSAPMPAELYNRFKKETGVEILEGYGLTECTCLVAVNPPEGAKKIGSVGLPFPYTHIRILNRDSAGHYQEAGVDEVGEICIASPGVFAGSTYTEVDKNHELFAEDRFLRSGDLGRIDPEGYLFITGRAKDLIIRGGHNIDPAVIEEALMGHPAVALVGAIGQPDPHAGELPAAYVELVRGASVTEAELLDHAVRHITERAAVPKFIGILEELPKTAVGKVFKPDLRRLAIARIYDAALAKAGFSITVAGVADDKKLGLVAQLYPRGAASDAQIAEALGCFTGPWAWHDQDSAAGAADPSAIPGPKP